MQTVIVTGRLGRDAKIYTSSNGNRFITFSVASNTRVKKNEENTYWWDVVIPSHSVERYKNMVEYLTKGSAVIVQAELDPEIYYDNNNKDLTNRISVTDNVTKYIVTNTGINRIYPTDKKTESQKRYATRGLIFFC